MALKLPPAARISEHPSQRWLEAKRSGHHTPARRMETAAAGTSTSRRPGPETTYPTSFPSKQRDERSEGLRALSDERRCR